MRTVRLLQISAACILFSFPVHGVNETWAWVKGIWRNPRAVSTVFSCSEHVANEITYYLQNRESDEPLRILEVGPGTGALTETILKVMAQGDTIDLVELIPEFCQVLTQRYGGNNGVGIHCMPIEQFTSDVQYDLIISTIPFNNLSLDLVRKVLQHYTTLIKPGGYISYVEYLALGRLKYKFMRAKKRRIYDKKRKLLKQWRTKHQVRKKIVIRNVPPITVYHLKIGDRTQPQ